MNMLEIAETNNVPITIATTGFANDLLAKINEYSTHIPIFMSSNMSYDVNLLEQLLRKLAPKLSDYDIEIVEIHHNRKKDAPSGTAKTLADAINVSLNNSRKNIYGRTEQRKANEIGIASLRGGNVVGVHTVNFFGQFSSLQITHTAFSRDLFAEGALKATRFMVHECTAGTKFGLFGMNDLMEYSK